MKKNLYQITTDYSNIINELEENLGDITPELEEKLMINEKELQSKSISYISVVSDRESLNTRIDDEIKRLQAMKKSNNNLIAKLKDRLLDAVKLFGNFEVGLTKFGTRKSSQVIVEDVNSLPSEFKTIKVTESANKAEIKKAIKAGESIGGCELVENLNLKIN
jgi:hypothetical protein